MFGEGYVIAEDVGECSVSILALERCGSEEHFVNKDPQSPPIHRTGVAAPFNDFWGNVLLCPNKGVCTEIGNAGFGINGG